MSTATPGAGEFVPIPTGPQASVMPDQLHWASSSVFMAKSAAKKSEARVRLRFIRKLLGSSEIRSIRSFHAVADFLKVDSLDHHAAGDRVRVAADERGESERLHGGIEIAAQLGDMHRLHDHAARRRVGEPRRAQT